MPNILKLIMFFSMSYGLFMIFDISIIKIINYSIDSYPIRKKDLRTIVHRYRNPEKEKLIKELQNSLPLLDNLVYWEEKYNQEMILHKPERTHKNLLLAIQNFVDRKENKS